MQTVPTINISFDKKCAECGSSKSGVAENGLCLGCTTKAIKGKRMKSAQGAAVAQRMHDLKMAHRR